MGQCLDMFTSVAQHDGRTMFGDGGKNVRDDLPIARGIRRCAAQSSL